MYDFCPLCLKNGTNSKIRSFQINLKEAVWLCESENCSWPFFSKSLEYMPRLVGKKWSGEWELYKRKSVQPREQFLSDLVLYTPPDTPVTDNNKDTSVDQICIEDNSYHDSQNDVAFSQIILDHNYANTNNLKNETLSKEKVIDLTDTIFHSVKGVPIITKVETPYLNPHLSNSLFKKKDSRKIKTSVSEKQFCSLEDVENIVTEICDNSIILEDKSDVLFAEKKSEVKESKMYEKFSFDKILSQKSQEKAKLLPKKIDKRIVPVDVINLCEPKKEDISKVELDKNQSNNSSDEIKLEDLLNDISHDKYTNLMQDLDTDWLDSLLL